MRYFLPANFCNFADSLRIMEYNFKDIEKKWQSRWAKEKTFSSDFPSDKPKYYVLDMFPYPSGSGLHVGHPLGYIASDILARFKRHMGYNVLHPMGYDSFGLPAEQYAIQTGQHPALTTENNINRYREQLDKMGFSYDWDREVRTSDADYYKWTQWIFIQLFNSWYNPVLNKAEKIESLIEIFETKGFSGSHHEVLTGDVEHDIEPFSKDDWKSFSEKKKSDILMNFRLAYLGEAYVNWCPALGTVLANDEIKDGLSERGGHPVERKLMRQWSMRITQYAQRLLDGLDKIDWTDSLKEAQRYWIGKSEGASIHFPLETFPEKSIEVFTTRPDTVFGVAFLTIAPESDLVNLITVAEQKQAVEAYVNSAKNRSERERQADISKVTGVFTGAYAIHPFSGNKIPVWVGDYVLAGYGTGAVMAVPGHDARDHRFAKHFNLPIIQVIEGKSVDEEANEVKEGKMMASDFLNGLEVKQAIKSSISEIEKRGFGSGKVNFRLRDAVFGRQRYWGEPIPVYYKNEIPYVLPEAELPLLLPEIDKYLPTETGEPPLARAENWKYKNTFEYEHSTMPGWAGSSWYFIRYMDSKNAETFSAKEKINYWNQIDLYLGGSEHATGHLLYFRFWTMVLHDLGYLPFEEPAKKLINQGMIQGRSNFVYRINGTNTFVSKGLKSQYETTALHVDVNIVENDQLDLDAFRNWRDDFQKAEFILEDGKYVCGHEVEKMSKSKWNVVSPDSICSNYGADTLRLYEMFLGPLELSKPWNTNGITGVSGFLKKLWRLFHQNGSFNVSDDIPSKEELKSLHKAIKKITEDIERFSFNTSVSTFMICVNELSDLKCNKKKILETLLILISPYAPHITEELYEKMGYANGISTCEWPEFNPAYLTEDSFRYPVSFNGKMKFQIELPIDLSADQIEKEMLSRDEVQKFLNGAVPKKIIVVPKKIVNFVL